MDAFNERMTTVLTPGNFLCIDESFSYWLGLEGAHALEGMVHVTKMKGKPRGVGLMLKSTADGETGILVRLEMQEGAKEMGKKEFVRRKGADRNDQAYLECEARSEVYAAHTAITLRLAKPWFGSKRTVVADSAFASVETLLALRKHDLHFMGCVKTAHSGFCKAYLKQWAQKLPLPTRGSHHSCVSTYTKNGQERQMLAVGWLDKKLKTLITSRGTTLQGTPAKKLRHKIVALPSGEVITSRMVKEVPRPKVVEDFFRHFSAIDVHDHYRQGSLAIEDNWKTKSWPIRVFSTIVGMICTNAFLAYRYDQKMHFPDAEEIEFKHFQRVLARLLVTNEEAHASGMPTRPRGAENMEVSASMVFQIFITPLFFAGNGIY